MNNNNTPRPVRRPQRRPSENSAQQTLQPDQQTLRSDQQTLRSAQPARQAPSGGSAQPPSRRRAKPDRGRVFAARFVLFLVCFAIFSGIAAGAFFLSLRSGGGQPFKGYALSAADSDDRSAPVEAIDESASRPEEPKYDFTFKTDVSDYLKYIIPEDRDAYIKLINVSNLLDKSYVPDDLADVKNTRAGYDTQKLRLYAAKSLEAFLAEAKANGVSVSVTSGYRSYSLQNYLFTERVKKFPNLSAEEAYKAAARIVAIPGSSEHQSGLCLDMHNLTAADESFAKTDEAKWLAENCYKFGFILRYPEDKTELTGITFEPWHFRYVGFYHAANITSLGMCLEEYTEYLNSTGYFK